MTIDQYPFDRDRTGRTGPDSDSPDDVVYRKAVNDSVLRGRNPVVSMTRSIYGTLHRIRFDGGLAYLDFDLDDRGTFCTDIKCYADTGKELARYTGRSLRLNGGGTWERVGDGQWKLLSYSVGNFVLLPDKNLREEVDEICRWFQEHNPSSCAPPEWDSDASDDFSQC